MNIENRLILSFFFLLNKWGKVQTNNFNLALTTVLAYFHLLSWDIVTFIEFAQINEIILTTHLLLHNNRYLTQVLLKSTCVHLEKLFLLAVTLVWIIIYNFSKALT